AELERRRRFAGRREERKSRLEPTGEHRQGRDDDDECDQDERHRSPEHQRIFSTCRVPLSSAPSESAIRQWRNGLDILTKTSIYIDVSVCHEPIPCKALSICSS